MRHPEPGTRHVSAPISHTARLDAAGRSATLYSDTEMPMGSLNQRVGHRERRYRRMGLEAPNSPAGGDRGVPGKWLGVSGLPTRLARHGAPIGPGCGHSGTRASFGFQRVLCFATKDYLQSMLLCCCRRGRCRSNAAVPQ